MNSINITGRIGKDIELKYTQSGKKVVNLSVAVYRNKETTDWFDCTAFEQSADLLANYCKKGDPIGLSGSMQSRTYNDSNGVSHRVWELIVNQVSLVASRSTQTGDTPATNRQPSAPAPTPTYAPPAQDDQSFNFNIRPEDLPF